MKQCRGVFSLFKSLIFLSILYWEQVQCRGNATVYVTIGTKNRETVVMGATDRDWNGGEFYRFLAIPYARPPIGNLRFKDPRPLKSMPTYIDARHEGHDCPSLTATNPSENCLTLNIYTKTLCPKANLPVLLYIHGGSFLVGSGLYNEAGPQYLMMKNIVVVTINYRLGGLGFLNLGTKEIPGNAGLKDQVMAMKWVKEYITAFGGNCEDITLLGYSVGGVSVNLHLLSSMSRHLFQKAIMMSGNFPPQYVPHRNHQRVMSRKQTSILGCKIRAPQDSAREAKEILKCLNKFDANQLVATIPQMFVLGSGNLWLPIIEKDFGQERFLTEDLSICDMASVKHPMLIGFTNGELCSMAAEVISNPALEQRFYEDFEKIAPQIFLYENNKFAKYLTQQLQSHYLCGASPGKSDFHRMCALYSDAIAKFGAHRVATLASYSSAVTTYKFTYKSEFSPNLGTPLALHFDDLAFIFRSPTAPFSKTGKDAPMIDIMVDFITEFMRNGRINSKVPHNYIEINRGVSLKAGVNFDEANFWDRLWPATECKSKIRKYRKKYSCA